MADRDDPAKFAPFTIHTTPYKTVHTQSVTVDIMYPTKLLSDLKTLAVPRPVIMRFHGGALVTGGSLYPAYFGSWLLDFAQRHDAVIISADYQLFPEASPADILSDITDLWKWTQSSLATYLTVETKDSVTIDLSRIITTGESAGGLMALLLALEQPDDIKAVMMQYPMLDLKAPHFTQSYEKKPFGSLLSQYPKPSINELLNIAREHEQQTGTKLVVSSDPTLTRLAAALAAIMHGCYDEFIQGKDRGEDLYVFDRIRRGEKLPRGGVFVWHGSDDSIVPVDGSHAFAEVLREMDPELKFRLLIQPGEHGFDAQTKLQDGWVKEVIEEIEHTWLS